MKFTYNTKDGSIGYKANSKSPETHFAYELKAQVFKYIMEAYLEDRKDFSIREIRTNPEFNIEKGNHNISSRIGFLINKLTEIESPFQLVRRNRATFSVVC